MLSFILHPLIPTLFPSLSKDPRLFRSAEPNITDPACLPFALSRLVLHTRCPAEQGRPPVGQGGDGPIFRPRLPSRFHLATIHPAAPSGSRSTFGPCLLLHSLPVVTYYNG